MSRLAAVVGRPARIHHLSFPSLLLLSAPDCWTSDRCRDAIAELAVGCEIDDDCVLGHPTQEAGEAMNGAEVNYSVMWVNAEAAADLWVGDADCQARYYPHEYSSGSDQVPVCRRGICDMDTCDPDTYDGHCPSAPW